MTSRCLKVKWYWNQVRFIMLQQEEIEEYKEFVELKLKSLHEKLQDESLVENVEEIV